MWSLQNRFAVPDYDADYSQRITYPDTHATEMIFLPGGGYVSSKHRSSVINSMYATRSGLIVFTSYRLGNPFFRAPIPKPNDER